MSNDQQIVEACIRQERVAQRKLYEQFSGKLFGVAMRYMKDREEAQDVLQDAFVKIFRKIDTFRFDCPLEAWMRKIVVNTALKVLQKNAQMKWVDIDGQYDLEDQNQQNLGLENMKMDTLLGMVNELPEGSRMVFNLYAIEGYKHHEIAEMLGINEGTSKSQYSRAKNLLSEKIVKENNRLAKSRSEYERGF
ncbi:MAG: RNA polymerase sigma factor [Spirosomataceae bacterium]|jgi:RNA polymerase sigma-70 factor (ECF subfamily)|nr:RNA polymerase sigma factor [Bacteroidota bacterium]